MADHKIVLLGGSGIRDSPAFQDASWKTIDTGFSNGVGDGKVECQERDDGVIFIPRHGNMASYGPSDTQYGANLIAARMLGARIVIATSAVGSLKPHIGVESLVIPDDYIDQTGRDDNIFGHGIVVHLNPRPAFSEHVRSMLAQSAEGCEGCFKGVHPGGTYVAIPGDRFGTAAEGRLRAQYADIVGMTACPEASMAMQLGLHYAVAAFVVDLDHDANHGGTLDVMKRLSARVPAYLSKVVEIAKASLSDVGRLEQLMGNIMPGDTARIANRNLRAIADRLIEEYH